MLKFEIEGVGRYLHHRSSGQIEAGDLITLGTLIEYTLEKTLKEGQYYPISFRIALDVELKED